MPTRLAVLKYLLATVISVCLLADGKQAILDVRLELSTFRTCVYPLDSCEQRHITNQSEYGSVQTEPPI